MELQLSGLRWLRTQSVNGLLGFVYVALAGAAYQAQRGPLQQYCVLAVVGVAVLAWAAALRRARAIVQIASSRIASAAQGYVELQGRTLANNPLRGPVTYTPCIWYRHHIYRRDEDEGAWERTHHEESHDTFELNDGSGQCTVDPEHAEVVGVQSTTRMIGLDKHVEDLLPVGGKLYVLGEFSTESGSSEPLNLRDDVAALLNTWKQNPTELHRRFDLDRSGHIDLQEWEFARRLAQRTVEKEHHALRQIPGVHLMRAPRSGQLYLISSLSPQDLRRHYLLWSAAHLAIGLAAGWFLATIYHLH